MICKHVDIAAAALLLLGFGAYEVAKSLPVVQRDAVRIEMRRHVRPVHFAVPRDRFLRLASSAGWQRLRSVSSKYDFSSQR